MNVINLSLNSSNVTFVILCDFILFFSWCWNFSNFVQSRRIVVWFIHVKSWFFCKFWRRSQILNFQAANSFDKFLIIFRIFINFSFSHWTDREEIPKNFQRNYLLTVNNFHTQSKNNKKKLLSWKEVSQSNSHLIGFFSLK